MPTRAVPTRRYDPLVASDFLSRRRGTTPDWYVPFLHRPWAYVDIGSCPILQQAPSLDDEEETGKLTATMDRMKALQRIDYRPIQRDR